MMPAFYWYSSWLILRAGKGGTYVRLFGLEAEWDGDSLIDAMPVIVGSAILLVAIYAWITMGKKA